VAPQRGWSPNDRDHEVRRGQESAGGSSTTTAALILLRLRYAEVSGLNPKWALHYQA